MSVYSMTGYSQAMGDANTPGEAGVAIELRSVNSRFLDLAFRMPDELRPIEPVLRELLTQALRRGKVEVRVATRESTDGGLPHPQPEQLNALSSVEATILGWMPHAQPLSVHEAMQWCRGGATAPRSDEALTEIARKAIAALNEARRREGAKLVTVLSQRIARLRELASEAEPLLPQVVERQQQRFLERWRAALESTGAAQSVPAEALQERALGEAAAFALRIDVAEELARLRAHLDEVERLLSAGGEIGKRLDFLIQELHREANTLGSKSAALELTQISVEMKVAIEQMREQVQNIE